MDRLTSNKSNADYQQIPSPMEQDGSSFHPTPNPAHFTPQDSSPNNNNVSEAKLPKKKGRKGHSKSRAGCFNCKRARIKCNEIKPSCDYCAHRDFQCEWPEVQKGQHMDPASSIAKSSNQIIPYNADVIMHPPSPLVIPIEPQVQGPVFTMLDFRLFQFFRDSAYPHQPVGNDSVWRHEIPCIASSYDFLLHSMLALSASELAATSDPTPQMNSVALTHRVKAISSLNVAISRGITGFEEGNAMLASCFALLFQSCLLEDGLIEYMMFIRGTVSVGITMGTGRMNVLFDKLFGNQQVEQVDSIMQRTPLIHSNMATAANRSFERFKHLCTQKVELDAFAILSSISAAMITSSRDAYMNLREMYALFSYHMSQPEFAAYCNTSSVPCQLLHAHFVALQLIMSPITSVEFTFKEKETGKRDDGDGKTVIWLIGIHRRVPKELEGYFAWTMWVQREVLSGRMYSGRVVDEETGSLDNIMDKWNEDWGVVTGSGV